MLGKCEAQVPDGGRWPSFHRCSFNAVVETPDGKFCKKHDPAKQQAREALASRKYKAQTELWLIEKEFLEKALNVVGATEGAGIEGSDLRQLRRKVLRLRKELIDNGWERPTQWR